MEFDQQGLVSDLTYRMNEAMTAWVVVGPYELSFITARLVSRVPLLADSIAGDDGFALSRDGRSTWICMDGDKGSGVFLFPEDDNLFNREMHKPVLGLAPELTVAPGIYGNVDPFIWAYIGGAEVVPAQKFLS